MRGGPHSGLQTTLPTGPDPARIYDALLGGKDNYPVDRAVASELARAKPDLKENVRANRQFLTRIVAYLTADAGVRQFIDIGAGLPTAGNVHEVAQQHDPAARVIYVDNNPQVLAHARGILAGDRRGLVEFLEADARDPERILSWSGRYLDFTQPIAVMLLGILHLIPDSDSPHRLVKRLMGDTAAGSYLAISHPASDINGRAAARGARLFAARTGMPQTNRNHQQVTQFFHGLDLVAPGIVQLSQWQDPAGTPRTVSSWGGLGRKPLSGHHRPACLAALRTERCDGRPRRRCRSWSVLPVGAAGLLAAIAAPGPGPVGSDPSPGRTWRSGHGCAEQSAPWPRHTALQLSSPCWLDAGR